MADEVKQENTVKPRRSIRREIVAKNIAAKVGKGGKISVSKEMAKAGYSDTYAKNPDRLTGNETFNQLLDKYLPDADVLNLHAQVNLAGKHRVKIFPDSWTENDLRKYIEAIPGCAVARVQRFNRGSQKNPDWRKRVYYLVPDYIPRKQAIELAYKVKGRMAPEVHEHHFEGMSNEQLVNYIMAKIAEKRA